MSRVGKSPVTIPDKTKVDVSGKKITVTGPLGTLERVIHPAMTATVEDSVLTVTRASDQKEHRAIHGLTRALIANMVEGVTTGFTRELKMIGVGYKAEAKGKVVVFSLGYSHPIIIQAPDGVSIDITPKEGKITVKGIDKEMVGLTAAKIRSFRKPEPYKGKGVRYIDEHVQIKAGKTAG